MKNYMKRIGIFSLVVIITIMNAKPMCAEAKDATIYYLGEGQHVKTDANYQKDKEISTGDAHYGWNLGKFCVSGFSGNPQGDDKDDNQIVFLKNVGDEISLSFLLEQNIDEIEEKETLSISDDKKAYDENFNILKDDQTDFGRGALHVKKTNYQNEVTYQHYMDYLNGVSKDANTEILLFEEGDYEIALDYQVRENHINFWKINTAPTYNEYQIKIAFKIRNSNCMVYPFDVKTGSELVNTSFTENGFYLDMAKSRYLDINIEKQNYIETDNKFETDTRFNKTATSGEEFTDQGIYIITVQNKYTSGKDTTKKIYVGADPILKAYVTTGNDVAYIKEMVEQGATIEEDGTITLPTFVVVESENEEEVTDSELLVPSDEEPIEQEEVSAVETGKPSVKPYVPEIVFISVLVIVIAFLIYSKKSKNFEVIPDPEEIIDDEESDRKD